MLTMACVLKSGGEYTPEYLYQMVDRFLEHNPGIAVKCLTDYSIDHPSIEPIPLEHKWPGWWSKIELFRPGLFDGPTLYMDIDTVTIGSVDIEFNGFTMLKSLRRKNSFGSGVMAWEVPPTHIYEKFCQGSRRWMSMYKTPKRWGDQGFIRDSLGFTPQTFGEQFRSFKAHCQDGVPEGAAVVYFHGKPRPWDVTLSLPMSSQKQPT